MKTKLILIIYFAATSLTLYAQKINHDVANSITKNMVVYQVLNDFSTSVPVFFMIPGWFVFGSIEISHIPIFVDEAYYNNVDVNSKNAIHKELFDATQVDFFPKIPLEKQMEVRVLDQGRLLYRLRFIDKGDSLELIQISGKGRDEKRFIIHQGNLLGIDHKDKHGLSTQRTAVFGDTLRIQTKHHAKTNRKEKTEIHYQDSRPKSIRYSKSKSNGSFKLTSSETYNYLGGRLSSIETSDHKGQKIDSTFFVHANDGELILIRKHKAGKSHLSIENKYMDNGLIEHKYVTTDNINYNIHYKYNDHKVTGYTIKNLKPNSYLEFNFDLNLDNQLSRIEQNTVYINVHPTIVNYESILFAYNPDGNVESIRVLDRKGQISKLIQFEYAYFGL